MRRRAFAWNRALSLPAFVLLAATSAMAACAPPVEDPERIARPGTPGRVAIEGGLWFDGQAFAPGTVYVEDGVFVERLSAEPDSVIDLAGGYVLPPFGDGHTHMLDGGPQMDAFVEQYESDGIYYVQVLTNLTTGAQAERGRFNQPGALDVTYANGGITSTLGHPFIAYEPRAMGIGWQEALERADEVRMSRVMEGNAYWFIDSVEDLDRQWESILAQGPDQLKIYLLRADDADHPADPGTMGLTGLTPELAAEVVRRADEAGVPVWAHVETARDFEIGLDIGVDGFAHLPGYQLATDDDEADFRLSDEVVARAGAAGVAITPTVTLIEFYAWDDSTRVDRARALQEETIQRLMAAGAKILVGTDSYGTTSAQEAWTLTSMLDARAVIDLWSRVTPQTLFPQRRIGRLAPGWEASFIVLGGNPLEDFARAADTRGGMKQGAWIASSVPPTLTRWVEP